MTYVFNANILYTILSSWFDNERWITGKTDDYGDARYVGLHGGRTSEIVLNEERQDEIKVYQIVNGSSYLGDFIFEFENGAGHSENLEKIGMFGSGHDFTFRNERNPSECHTTITIIK